MRIDEDGTTVTIQLQQKTEYPMLFAILRSFSTELADDRIDTEWLMRGKREAEAFLKDFFEQDQNSTTKKEI